ncbi:MAG: pentapeptide repeat-containing protein [Acidimicrobiales bacterium]
MTEGVVIENMILSGPLGAERVFDLHHSSGLVEIRNMQFALPTEVPGAAVRHVGAGTAMIVDTRAKLLEGDTGSVIASEPGSGPMLVWRTLLGSDFESTVTAIDASGSGLDVRDTFIGGAGVGLHAATQSPATVFATTITKTTIGITGNAKLFRTIVSGNTTNCTGTGISSLGSNIEDGDSCGFSANGDMASTDPELVEWRSSSTSISSPGRFSPAFDANPDGDPGCISWPDHFGSTRPTGAGCELGGIESVPSPWCTDPAGAPVLSSVVFCDLAGADLSGAHLALRAFGGSDFRGANLRDAGMEWAYLDYSSLAGADLGGVSLTHSSLRHVDLPTPTSRELTSRGPTRPTPTSPA